MPDNYVKVLTALGMHSNKLKLSGRLTVEFELPEMKNPLCSAVGQLGAVGIRPYYQG